MCKNVILTSNAFNKYRSRYFVVLREKKELLRTLLSHLCSSSRVLLFAITKSVLFTSTTVGLNSAASVCMYTKKSWHQTIHLQLIEYGKSIIRYRSTVNDINIILVSVSMSALLNLQNVVSCKSWSTCVCSDKLSVLQNVSCIIKSWNLKRIKY